MLPISVSYLELKLYKEIPSGRWLGEEGCEGIGGQYFYLVNFRSLVLQIENAPLSWFSNVGLFLQFCYSKVVAVYKNKLLYISENAVFSTSGKIHCCLRETEKMITVLRFWYPLVCCKATSCLSFS